MSRSRFDKCLYVCLYVNLYLYLFSLVESIKDESAFFAKRIRDCVQGFGTKDSHLIRIIVTRSEVRHSKISKYTILSMLYVSNITNVHHQAKTPAIL